MSICKLKDSPEKLKPLATLSLAVGLILLIAGNLWSRLHFLPNLSTEWNDFLHGFVIGLASTLVVGGAALTVYVAAIRAKKS
jgi:hypothetical protein